jgi:16S rRNA (cytosine1402-N4)-methyltransferase
MSSDDDPDRAYRHAPVLAAEVVTLFTEVPPGVIVDATLGGGGHSGLLLSARPDCTLLGLDRDPAALAAAGERLAPFGDRVTLRHARFDHLNDVMAELHLTSVSGVLFDLGVSSPQLDWADRGFSYRQDGPLDMRMDQTEQWSAADVVNGYPEADLVRMLRDHADERFAERIARAIVAARPIDSTVELASVVRDAIPAPARRHGGHPAKRTFQAIRIEVNGELSVLPAAIDAAIDAVMTRGRVAVISYHSGEDRLVKSMFREAATGGCECPPGLPCVCGAVRTVRLVRPGAIKPTKAELASNRRAESARLRAVEKLPQPAAAG